MNEILMTIFGLLGGLALFLFGMNQMSESLQKSAGEKMRSILGALTKNPLMGALAGALVTAVLQSSSATTVMVIGFVSAGLIGLPQAISVIFGANIGTTMTAQLIAFNISDYIYPIIFIGFIINFLAKNEKVKNISMVIFSFGLLFEGINIMSSVMKPLAASPVFTQLMDTVKGVPVLGVLLGTLMTVVVQSSSATIAVLQSFASQAGPDGTSSVIGLMGAIPILLGDNIGTTITAILASIGQSRNSKRTAIAHSLFNISGSVLFLFLLKPFASLITLISPKGPEVEVISRQIANAHTTFNVVMTLIWLPLLPLMVKIVMKILPGTRAERTDSGRPVFLDRKVMKTPSAAIQLVGEELKRCTGAIHDLFPLVRGELLAGRKEKPSEDLDDLLSGTGRVLSQTADYLTEMFSTGSMLTDQAEEASGLLQITRDLARIRDRFSDIVTEVRRIRQDKKSFSEEALSELGACLDRVSSMYDGILSLLSGGPAEDGKKVVKGRNKLSKAVKKFNKSHLIRVREGRCPARMTKVYAGILYQISRIGDNCVSIAEEKLDGQGEGEEEVEREA